MCRYKIYKKNNVNIKWLKTITNNRDINPININLLVVLLCSDEVLIYYQFIEQVLKPVAHNMYVICHEKLEQVKCNYIL